jgi:hypothetical protein
MNRTWHLFFITGIFLLAGDGFITQSSVERLKSSDLQLRCDAFYEIFGNGVSGETVKSSLIYGKTTKKVHELLGDPTSIYTLEHKSIKWLRISYLFDICPTKASIDEKAACKKGWRYSPSVLFRNGISVPKSVFAEETGEGHYSVTPEHLTFRKGGVFP